ncbi:MAG: oligoendopeptidase F [Silvanigrellaceae bacterium]|nr:oligoendopeptidase F [Silvanigrellaceae bacterium]
MENEKIKTRGLVSTEETWDLTDLFYDFQSWEKNFAALPSIEELCKVIEKKYKNKLSTSPDCLYECLQFRDELSRKLENLFVYASLRCAEDVANQQSNGILGKIEIKMSSLLAQFSFLEPEILTIKEIGQWILQQPLETYAFKIKSLLRSSLHVLSEKEEAILAKLAVPLRNSDDVHSKWNSADLRFENALDAKGVSHLVTHSRYGLHLESQDRTLRKNTFLSLYKEIAQWRNTITANYYGNVSGGSLIAKIRNFPSFIEAELFQDDVPVTLYTNLIETVKKNLFLLHRSMELRKAILKVDSVQPYDRYVPLYTAKKPVRFSWEEGRDLVLEALRPLGDEYVSIARRGLTDERWIDRAENQGKRTGAFSWGTYDSRPYMLQTWKSTLSDVFTLAHELGHSMHSFYSHKNQPYHNASYTIFVAEVASTLNEALLSHHILTTMPNTDLAFTVMGENVKNFEGTVLRQTLFAAFELYVAQIVDQGETLTPEALESYYLELNKQWYGSASAGYPDFLKYEWMRIPHFYSNFYVYKYATSYCASLALKQQLLADPTAGRESIFNLLKAGGSKPSLEILKEAGVDLLSSEPINKAFENYKDNIEQTKLINKF